MTRTQSANPLIKKIHVYLGLLNLSILLVFGLAGLRATFHPPGVSPNQEQSTRVEPFTAPAGVIDDKQLGEFVRGRFNIAAVDWNAKRDDSNNLVLSYYTQTGPWYITVLEKENQLRINRRRATFGGFLDNLHATANRHPEDWRVRLWTYYNEFSVWSLIAMSLSGVYLWLRSRPNHRWALVSFAAGTGAFLLLMVLSR